MKQKINITHTLLTFAIIALVFNFGLGIIDYSERKAYEKQAEKQRVEILKSNDILISAIKQL